MNNTRIEFDKHEFDHYNLLKIKSKNRTQLGKNMHFGLVFSNDKFRYHLYINHKDNRLPGSMSFSKSQIYSFDINPYTNKIKNTDSVKEFLNHLNLFQKISDEELYYHYMEFEKIHNEAEKYSKFKFPEFEKMKNKIIDRFSSPSEKELNEFEKKLEEIEYKILKRKFE
jgi:hypothetical protein